jgi:hypothetical protein
MPQTQVFYTILKINLLLIPPQCPISKRLYDERIPCDYVWSAASHRKTAIFPAKDESQKAEIEIKLTTNL